MIHPDIECLVRYRERDLPPNRWSAVDGHLRTCQDCRREYQALLDAMTPHSAHATPSNLAGTESMDLSNLLAAIQGWAAATDRRADEDVKQRVAGKVEKYLGDRATRKILLTVSRDGGNLLSNIEPVLALFLGRRAASRLVSHVVDTAIVRC